MIVVPSSRQPRISSSTFTNIKYASGDICDAVSMALSVFGMFSIVTT